MASTEPNLQQPPPFTGPKSKTRDSFNPSSKFGAGIRMTTNNALKHRFQQPPNPRHNRTRHFVGIAQTPLAINTWLTRLFNRLAFGPLMIGAMSLAAIAQALR